MFSLSLSIGILHKFHRANNINTFQANMNARALIGDVIFDFCFLFFPCCTYYLVACCNAHRTLRQLHIIVNEMTSKIFLFPFFCSLVSYVFVYTVISKIVSGIPLYCKKKIRKERGKPYARKLCACIARPGETENSAPEKPV